MSDYVLVATAVLQLYASLQADHLLPSDVILNYNYIIKYNLQYLILNHHDTENQPPVYKIPFHLQRARFQLPFPSLYYQRKVSR